MKLKKVLVPFTKEEKTRIGKLAKEEGTTFNKWIADAAREKAEKVKFLNFMSKLDPAS